MRRTLIVTIAVLGLVGAACSSNSSTTSSGGTTSAPPVETTTSAPAGCTQASATDLSKDDPFTVTIEGFAFHPDCFVAKSSSAITIENKDDVTHTFTIDGTQVDATINGGDTFNGESANLDPGTYQFHCKIHTSMTGTVIVV